MLQKILEIVILVFILVKIFTKTTWNDWIHSYQFSNTRNWIRVYGKYFSAHQELSRFSLIHEDDIVWLSYRILDPRIKKKRQDAELSLGMFCNIFKKSLGKNWSPLEIRFEHLETDGYKEHESRFNCPVEFGRRTNAIAFRKKILKQKSQTVILSFSIVKSF
ncbi:MAG: hypothetical protein CM15mP109_14940 [Candidatus Dadabacteria bacterium]|nr:MAG: hypothetical protein CM15mP109_14940 [Candidatus Dadabacteria bacterium]